eukprot:c13174_g1_i1.p1 GENE.c13174_g1_i1~~c13174_g1_i1.p1  ORF type:complete len:590 (+),score=129.48 c13174_g1_i1:115-1884(+)
MRSLEVQFASYRKSVQRKQQQQGKDDPTPPPKFVPVLPNTIEDGCDFVAVQRIFTLPFTWDLVYVTTPEGSEDGGASQHEKEKDPEDDSTISEKEKARKAKRAQRKTVGQKKKNLLKVVDDLTGSSLRALVRASESKFETRFGETFGLREYGTEDRKAAMAALSNLIGGIGYFYGSSLQTTADGSVVRVSPSELFTAVPSRPFFPRGFLWDEGFHQLLVQKWDQDITYEILDSWLKSMNSEGWIAREQILGDEARSKVPEKFQAQNKQYANPPTLFLALLQIAKQTKSGDAVKAEAARTFLRRQLPRLRTWYGWYNTTQSSHIPHVYRWRGREADHTLTSGLDDYPRAHRPNDRELHLDLTCWMGFASHALGQIAEALGNRAEANAWKLEHSLISNAIKDQFWNNQMGTYQDKAGSVPPGTFDVVIDPTTGREKKIPITFPASGFVEHTGYISLFPLITGMMDSKETSRLSKILELMQDSNQLMSPGGLRSMSKSDPLFGKGENYWRGPVWVNVNYLALRSLHSLASASPQAATLYNSLRRNVVSNILKEYHRTGYFWEQYHPESGKGQRSHPFTGWTALVLLIMSETF